MDERPASKKKNRGYRVEFGGGKLPFPVLQDGNKEKYPSPDRNVQLYAL